MLLVTAHMILRNYQAFAHAANLFEAPLATVMKSHTGYRDGGLLVVFFSIRFLREKSTNIHTHVLYHPLT